MNQEIEWRVIEDFPSYKVSNCGDMLGPSGKILKSRPQTKSTHQLVWLRKDGNTYAKSVHRLVALTFLGQPPSTKHEVCHNDGNPENNHVDNLRWGTRGENLRDMSRHGTRTQPNPTPKPGIKHPQHKLSYEQVVSIRTDTDPYNKIAAKHGISTMTAYRCKNRISYSDIP